MRASFLKKLDEIERRAKKISSDVPDLIMIHFREDLNKWIVQKWFLTEGSCTSRQAVEEYEVLKKYVLPVGFTGTCITDNLFVPDGVECPVIVEPEETSQISRCVHVEYVP